MPKKLKLSIAIIVGILLVSYFLFGFTIAIIGVTKGDNGYYTIGNKKAVLASTNLMQGNRDGSFSNGELVLFKNVTINHLSQNDVVLFKDGDGLSIKRVKTILFKDDQLVVTVASDAPSSTVTVLTPKDLVGIYDSSSKVLGNLIGFSTRFSGVLVLYILPSILLFSYVLFFSIKNKH